jgi:NAD(P)-dependent dehydrogenase (short-subunit alcohol dehydrogenase family)
MIPNPPSKPISVAISTDELQLPKVANRYSEQVDRKRVTEPLQQRFHPHRFRLLDLAVEEDQTLIPYPPPFSRERRKTESGELAYAVPMSKQRTILITGCSSGIGLCVAEGLKQRGYRVIATARKSQDVDRLTAQGFESLPLDLDNSASIEEAVEETLKRCNGRLYALFNNGAYGQPGAVEDLSRKTLRQQFETNLFGWHELTCRIIPSMREAGEGRIIQNSSILGLIALPYRGAYVASKYALEGLSDTLRLELAGSGIHVTLVEPGPILSRFRENALIQWRKNIDPERSYHRDHYQAMLARLEKEGPATPFTLPPEAVLKKVIHALESPRPRPRYAVTFPTYLFSLLRRLLSSGGMDRVLLRVSRKGRG